MLSNFRIRNENHKNTDLDQINKMNSFISNRIISKSSCMSIKKLDQEFSKTLQYKNYSKKFELPDITRKG